MWGWATEGLFSLVCTDSRPASSLVPHPLLACARKGLVKSIALPCPRGTYSAFQSGCRKIVTWCKWNVIIDMHVAFTEFIAYNDGDLCHRPNLTARSSRNSRKVELKRSEPLRSSPEVAIKFYLTYILITIITFLWDTLMQPFWPDPFLSFS